MEVYRPRRRPSDLRITLSAPGLKKDVKLLDVSETGMKLTCPEPLPADALVEVTTPRIARSGRVRWSNRGTVGVALSEPLSDAEQVELSGMIWGV